MELYPTQNTPAQPTTPHPQPARFNNMHTTCGAYIHTQQPSAKWWRTASMANTQSHQFMLLPNQENAAWGNMDCFEKPQGHFHVIFKNIGTINPKSMDILAATKLSKMDASIFLAQETNIAWNPSTEQTIKSQTHHAICLLPSYGHLLECREIWQHNQPGGILMMALDKWSCRVI